MNDFYRFIAEKYPDRYALMQKYGRRNVSFSTVAPTGTTSLMTQTSSGLEPVFLLYYKRRKKGNPGDKDFRSDFVDESGDHWMEFYVVHPQFERWLRTRCYDIDSPGFFTEENLRKAYEESPWYESLAPDIDWLKRVRMQAVVQKYTTHSISSTINLPTEVSEEKVGEIYMHAWQQGLKGVTVYRDGCRTGVLLSATAPTPFHDNDAPKRNERLSCHVYHASTQGQRFTMIVGLMDERPYETFIIPGHRGKQTKEAELVKVMQGEYDLVIQNGTERIYTDMTETMTPEQVMVSRLLSWGLRHGGGVKHAVEQLEKCPSDHMFSFNKIIIRVMKNYIADGEKSSAKCLDCGSDEVIYQEGCQLCMQCGSSKCG